MAKLQQTLQNLGLSTAALLITVALVEAGLRILAPEANPSPSWHYHRVLGWVQNPGHSYDYVVSGEDVRVAYNSQGFRDVERPLAKPADFRRVVVIGDSFSAAVEVNLEDTFSQRLEKILNARTTERWQVINLGVSDFGTAQEWLALEHLGLDFEPDVVIHQIFPLNDICNNGIDLAGLCKSTKDAYRPYFIETPAGLKQTSVQPLRSFLRRNLLIYRLGESAYSRFAPREELLGEAEYDQLLSEAGLLGLNPLLQTYVEDAEQIAPVARAWRVTELLIERIAALCRKRGVAYVGVVIPFNVRVGDLWDRFVASQPPPPMIRDYPEKRLGGLFESLGVPGVMMREVFEANTELVFPYRGGHLNPAAHWLTAESIYGGLREAGVVTEDPARAERLRQDLPAALSSLRESEQYRWGSAIRFGVHGDAWRYLRDGWWRPEETFNWTVARQATLLLEVPRPRAPVLLKANLSAFLFPGKVDRQRIRVLVNGEQAGMWTVTRAGFHEQTLLIHPSLFFAADQTVMTFEAPDAASPAAVGASNDQRVLGIAVESLELQTRAPDVEFVADPNPIRVCDGSGLGVTTLRWRAPGTEVVEVHVDSPAGPLFTRQSSEGSATTDKWVSDGMVFYLQDVSADKPLTADHTLATLTVRFTTECP